MYGDTSAIRCLAQAMQARADDVRHEADRLVGMGEQVPWTGRAAEAMRAHARDLAARQRRTAGLYDDAADALAHHADEVDRRKDLITAVEHRVDDLVAAARGRIADAARAVVHSLGSVVDGLAHGAGGGVDALDHLLDRFDPPPSGSMEWLQVDLPGVQGLLDAA